MQYQSKKSKCITLAFQTQGLKSVDPSERKLGQKYTYSSKFRSSSEALGHSTGCRVEMDISGDTSLARCIGDG